jgi:two-component system, OmpR family, sensor histidine kinase BaeS
MWWILVILGLWFFSSRGWRSKRWRRFRNDPNWQTAKEHWQRGDWSNARKFARQATRDQKWHFRRWGLRRRLTIFFAVVALVAVSLTTWLTLQASIRFFLEQGPGVFANPNLESLVNEPIHGFDDPRLTTARRAFGRVTSTALLAAFLSFLFASGAAAIIARLLTKPLNALEDAANRIAAGERGVRVKPPNSNDELRTVSEAFNGLIASLERQESWRRNMVADIAHDLRTPLAVMRSELEAMQDGIRTPDEAGLDRLHSEVLLLSRLVDDLRTLSLAESGGMKLELKETALQTFLGAVLESFSPRATSASIALKLEVIPPDLKAKIDETQITRVLNNLLENALKHSGTKQITVSATLEPEFVHISIRDYGKGLSNENLERAFERFYRGDASRTRGTDGSSGLGLAIARAIVEAHHGKLEAGNHSDGGAVFTILLPVV